MVPKSTLEIGKHKAISSKIVNFLILFIVLGVTLLAFDVYMTRHSYITKANSEPPSGAVKLCIKEEEKNDLSHWTKPPKLMHNMSDEELFWRASFASELKSYPYNRIPKVAFMFLTIGPLPLLPLWDKFFRGNEGLYSIYIHALPSYKDMYPLDSVFHGRRIPSKVAEWGRMSVCDAERRLLANALLDYSNERFVLVSESCIPLHNFSVVYNYLINSEHSFIGSFDDPSVHGRGRYDSYMLPEITEDQWRKGAQWFEVQRRLAIMIVSDTKYYPKLRDFCLFDWNCYPDEHYFPTMLSIEAPSLIANRSVTMVDWSAGGAHPAIYGKEDIEEKLFKRILEGNECAYNGKSSTLCFLFARKFSPSALGSLMNSTNLLGF